MTPRQDHSEGWCCQDCLILLANGETPPELDEEETAGYLARISDDLDITLGRHTDDCGCDDWDTDHHRDYCENDEFAWSSCDVCHSHLGGSRHAVTFWFPAEVSS